MQAGANAPAQSSHRPSRLQGIITVHGKRKRLPPFPKGTSEAMAAERTAAKAEQAAKMPALQPAITTPDPRLGFANDLAARAVPEDRRLARDEGPGQRDLVEDRAQHLGDCQPRWPTTPAESKSTRSGLATTTQRRV
jgi:hypothetical protein